MTNIAILGAGNIAKSMAKTLHAMKQRGDEVCLYAVASRELTRAQSFAREEGFRLAYGSYEEMVCDPAVELVYIATPHSHHAAQIRLCVEHGKAVLCEKAFTATAMQAREVLTLAEDRGVLVTEAIWPRYMPVRAMLQELLQSGVIGNPVYLTANLGYDTMAKPRIYDPALAGGALLDVGISPLTFASMVLGDEIVKAEGTCTKLPTGVDMTDNITLTYVDGKEAHIATTCICRTDRRGMIYGTAGFLEVDNVNNPQSITIYRKEDNFTASRIIAVPKQLTGYEYEVEACMRAMAEGRIECPEMPHEEIIRMMELMDRLRSSWGIRYPFE